MEKLLFRMIVFGIGYLGVKAIYAGDWVLAIVGFVFLGILTVLVLSDFSEDFSIEQNKEEPLL
ncbi:MAG: hypothetical protein A3A30_04950 [Candidatus Terrybacteria bacterium RIFCSPLOWO2_01_FULL_48_14]|nr:MAG: hypothetical protein A3A30_04950 [Candidatus Terrybacteria bacterium RIFCSPLOWO2_01_FULL_48_14]